VSFSGVRWEIILDFGLSEQEFRTRSEFFPFMGFLSLNPKSKIQNLKWGRDVEG
jgi:hypothetical protein